MEGMLMLTLVIVLIVLISMRSSLSNKINELSHKLDDLARQLERFRQNVPSREEKTKPAEATPRVEIAAAAPVVRPEEIKPVERPREEPVKREEPRPAFVPQTPRPVDVPQVRVAADEKVHEKKPGFFERNPDLEKFIGENLINKIGIGILVLGIGYFVKLAIDQEWINEIGRVFIGVLCGGILLGLAHRLRKTFAAFSSVLVGGGIAVMYFTITIAFHEYHIFSQAAAFVLMVVITGFTIILALGYNRVELAVLGILGGFGSPFMVSTGEGNYAVLFTYLLILNVGMIVLAYYKKWRIVNIICYVFTILIFGAWLSTKFQSANVPMIRGALGFATAFYLIFFLMNIINNIRERTKFEAVEILMLLSNTFLYFSAGMTILHHEVAKDFQGLFTATLGIFNFVFAYVLYKNLKADRNLVYMLIGLVLTFISLAAPIQLHGNYITLFWAAEAVLLLWLYQKSGIKIMAVASAIVMFLMIVSLLIDWKQIYLDNPEHLAIMLNKGYITSIVAIVSFILVLRLLKNEPKDSFIRKEDYSPLIIIVLSLLLYTANLLEIKHHALFFVDSYAARSVIVGTYNMFFILVLLLISNRVVVPAEMKKAILLLSLAAMGSYLFFYHDQIISTRREYFDGISPVTGFALHYVLVGLLLAGVMITLRKINRDEALTKSLRNGHWWLFIFFFIFIASAELDHLVFVTAYSGENEWTLMDHSHKIGYPILWGLASFILIAVGLQRKIKMLRVISLVLMSVTLLKLFIVDLANIPQAGKIAAFISLGILLLIVSFMYQRLKKLLVEDVPAK
jgi:uncharacterized membrane protein